jgi:hypothetical protein
MENKNLIKTVCAWCGKDMGFRDGQGVEGISHGICQECLKKQTKCKKCPWRLSDKNLLCLHRNNHGECPLENKIRVK